MFLNEQYFHLFTKKKQEKRLYIIIIIVINKVFCCLNWWDGKSFGTNKNQKEVGRKHLIDTKTPIQKRIEEWKKKRIHPLMMRIIYILK